jgi:hypothetical protein
MPAWLLYVLGGGIAYWFLFKPKTTTISTGTSSLNPYKVNKDGVKFYSSDPSLYKDATVPFTLDTGTPVVATTRPPTMSSDANYMLVSVANGTYWVSIADVGPA